MAERDDELLAALRAEAFSVPMCVDASVLRNRAGMPQRPFWLPFIGSPVSTSAVAVLAVLSIAFIAMIRLGITASVGPFSTISCPVSAVQEHGWWKEIGGPRVFFNVREQPEDLTASPYPWLLFARIDPDAGVSHTLQVWSQRLDGNRERVPGRVNRRVPTGTIINGTDVYPALPGGNYLIEEFIRSPGCWQLSASVDGEVIGTAVVRVGPEQTAYPPPAMYRTYRPIDGLCIAFSTEDRSLSDELVPAWWWDIEPGSTCSGSMSTVVSSRATLKPRSDGQYELTLDIALMPPADRETVRITLRAQNGAVQGAVQGADNVSVLFILVESLPASL